MVRRRHHHRINVLAEQQVAEVGNARNTAIGAGAVARRIGLLDLLGPLLPAVREAIADGGALRIGMFEKIDNQPVAAPTAGSDEANRYTVIRAAKPAAEKLSGEGSHARNFKGLSPRQIVFQHRNLPLRSASCEGTRVIHGGTARPLRMRNPILPLGSNQRETRNGTS